MTTATLILIILLWPLCLFIIGLILLQGGAGDISSAFGGGGQLDSTLGVGAGRKMSKLTGWLAGIFLLIVLALSVPHKGDFSKIAGESATVPKTVGAPVVVPPAPVSVPTVTPESAPPVVPVPAVVPAAPVVPAVPAPAVPSAAAPAPTAVPAPVAPPAQSGVKLE